MNNKRKKKKKELMSTNPTLTIGQEATEGTVKFHG
jgi:hypothetical protein